MRFTRFADMAALIGLTALIVCCTGGDRASARPEGLRTFKVLAGTGDSALACPAWGLTDPVDGILEGEPGTREVVWLRTEDGRQLSVLWPEGFTVRFEPDAAVYSDEGRLVARAGDLVTLVQTRPTDAAGTFEDPYFASGLIFGGCYQPQP